MSHATIPLSKKQNKSLSARTFQSKEKVDQSSLPIKNIHLKIKTQSSDLQTFAMTKKQMNFFSKTSRPIRKNINFKNQTISVVRDTQQLQEENVGLKQKIHNLSSLLTRQKIKRLQQEKSVSKIKQQFGLQFQKEIYYHDNQKVNTNIVQGLKHQYEIMKKKFQIKSSELDEFIKYHSILKTQELLSYAQVLELQNKKLAEKLKIYLLTQQQISSISKQAELFLVQFSEKQAFQNIRQPRKNQKLKRVEEMMKVYTIIIQTKDSLQNEKKRSEAFEQKIKDMKRILLSKDKKIEFLDRLLLQKDNCLKHSIKMEKKAERQLKLNQQNVTCLNEQIKQLEKIYEGKIQKIKQQENCKFQYEKGIFIKTIQERSELLLEKERQVIYFRTLLSYIKSNDDSWHKKSKDFSQLEKSISELTLHKDGVSNLELSIHKMEVENTLMLMSQRKRNKTIVYSNSEEKYQKNAENVSIQMIRINSEDENDGYSVQAEQNLNDQLLEQNNLNKNRTIKSSKIKHSENAKKVRKIKPDQLEVFKSDIIYKLMREKETSESIKDYFDYKPVESSFDMIEAAELQWKQEYINMKEIKTIFLNQPFQLNEQQAFLLARYIVQEQTQEYVFCDDENQIERIIAKSIIKAYLGEYDIPDQVICKPQISAMIQRFGNNLKATLHLLAPTGYIHHVKLLEIIQSIGIHLSFGSKNWLLSQLLVKSVKGMQQLEYEYLFQLFP